MSGDRAILLVAGTTSSCCFRGNPRSKVKQLSVASMVSVEPFPSQVFTECRLISQPGIDRDRAEFLSYKDRASLDRIRSPPTATRPGSLKQPSLEAGYSFRGDQRATRELLEIQRHQRLQSLKEGADGRREDLTVGEQHGHARNLGKIMLASGADHRFVRRLRARLERFRFSRGTRAWRGMKRPGMGDGETGHEQIS